jgi:ferric-dicitrate binding protein FerR (iron transport regulator)
VWAAAALLGALSLVAQQAPAPPVDPDGAARLLNFTGQISVVRSNYAWALNVGGVVKRQEVIVTGPDGWGVFQVADGSKFEVFPNSRIVFRANQGDWKDFLEVLLGKVRVQIEHFGGLPNNNKVHTPSAVISVRGTIFTVEVEDQTETTTVFDEEGVVAVRHALLPGGSERVLNPSEYVRVFKNQPIAKALFDKGNAMKQALRAASDVFYQAALNARGGTGTLAKGGGASTAGSGGGAGDQQHGGPAPPPPPPAPPHP